QSPTRKSLIRGHPDESEPQRVVAVAQEIHRDQKHVVLTGSSKTGAVANPAVGVPRLAVWRPRFGFERDAHRDHRMVDQVVAHGAVRNHSYAERLQVVRMTNAGSHENCGRVNRTSTQKDLASLETLPAVASPGMQCDRLQAIEFHAINERVANDSQVAANARRL